MEGKRRALSRGKRFGAEEIIGKLSEAEVGPAQGQIVAKVARKLGSASRPTTPWRREYGGMKVDQAKRLQELERENARLKRLVADQSLDNTILREVASGSY